MYTKIQKLLQISFTAINNETQNDLKTQSICLYRVSLRRTYSLTTIPISNHTKLYGFPDIVQFSTDYPELLIALLKRISSLIFLKVSYCQNLILTLNICLKTSLFWSNCSYLQ